MDKLFSVVGILMLSAILVLLLLYLKEVRRLISGTVTTNETNGKATSNDEIFTILIAELSKFIPYFLEIYNDLTSEDLNDDQKASEIAKLVYDEFYNYLLLNTEDNILYDQIVIFLDSFVDKTVLVNSIGKYSVKFINVILKNKELSEKLATPDVLNESVQKIIKRNDYEVESFPIQQDEDV